MGLLDHLLVPVAGEEDAANTCAALRPYLEGVKRVTVVHVVEKGGGTIDKAPIEKRRADAANYLALAERRLGDAVTVETQTTFGTDVTDAIFAAANDVGATAVVFHPRGGSRIVRLLAGDTAARLVTDPELPVVSLPRPTDE